MKNENKNITFTNICLTITKIRSHVNFGNNLREATAKNVRFYFTIVLWNILPSDIVLRADLDSFKEGVCKINHQSP